MCAFYIILVQIITFKKHIEDCDYIPYLLTPLGVLKCILVDAKRNTLILCIAIQWKTLRVSVLSVEAH